MAWYKYNCQQVFQLHVKYCYCYSPPNDLDYKAGRDAVKTQFSWASHRDSESY